MSASRIVLKNDNLYAVYMGNFRCGPDSFLTHFVRKELKGNLTCTLRLMNTVPMPGL
jgi:predicted nucleotide-binding protein (sugar kinase/HSP70/actin superfamily)